MTPHHSRPRGRRRGIALMLAVVYTTLVLSVWSLANHQTGALLRLREAHSDRLAGRFERDAGPEAFDPRRAALAGGLVLMTRPGFPDDRPIDLPRYTCRVAVDTDPGPFESLRPYILEYSWDAPAGRWDVTSFEEADWGSLASGPDPRRSAAAWGLDLLGGGGIPDALPGDPGTASEIRLDVDPEPDQVLELPFVVELLRIDTETWAVATSPREVWDGLGGPRREAIALGMAAIEQQNPPFDGADPGPPYRYRAGPGGPFALEFAEVGSGAWAISAFSEAEWDALELQPPWDELPPLPE